MEKNKKIHIVGILGAIIVVIAIITGVLIIKEYKAQATEKSISADNEKKSEISIKFTYYEDYWNKYDLTNAVYKTQDEYENAVLNYIDEIANLLNKQDWYAQYTGMNTLCLELHIDDLDDGSTQGTISSYKESLEQSTCTYDLNLSNTMFKHNTSQLAQTMVALVITNTHGVLSDMERGFSEYIENKLGVGNTSVNYGLDIHNYLISYTKLNEKYANNKISMNRMKDKVGELSHDKIAVSAKNIGNAYVPEDEMYNAYKVLCNYSFVDYLVQTYGIECVMKIIYGNDESIYNLYNQSGLSGLIVEWKLFLENYNCKMTWVEIDAYITQLKGAQGY